MFSRILVATDFSESSRQAADLALELARLSGGAVTLVHVWSPPVYPLPPPHGLPPDPALLHSLESAARAELLAEEQRLGGRGVALSSRTLLGAAAESVVALAGSDGFELVVVGTHGRTGIRRLVIGSVAEHVVRASTVPVLTVHARGGH